MVLQLHLLLNDQPNYEFDLQSAFLSGVSQNM